MRGLIDNKGAAHFEMIFSFVFFTGFVFFLFLFLSPQDTSTLSGAVINGLFDTFEEKVHTNLTNTFLKTKTDNDSQEECFVIELPGRIFTYALTKSYVTDLGGTEVPSNLIELGGGNGKLNVNNDSSSFRVAISPEFTDDSIGQCGVLDNYQLGNIVERRVISYNALDNMSKKYINHYEELRTELGVPPIFDFAIIIENMSGIVMVPQYGIPDGVEVVAQDYVIEVLRDDGRLTNERFNFRIW